jgi:hypothetical protein
MPPIIRIFIGVILFSVSWLAMAQTETGFVVHGLFSSQPNGIAIGVTCPVTGCPQPSPTADHVNAGVSFEGFVARRLVNAHVASLAVELPVLVMPNRGTDLASTFSTVAITPGVRVNFLPRQGASPFLLAGGGIVHFSGDTPSATKGAGLVGGGFDLRTPVPHLGARIEVKDLLTPWPSLFPKSGVMNNVVAGAGVVFKF